MVDFADPIGAEAAFRRPAVVVSNNAANESAFGMSRGVITVLPISSNVHRVYPFQVRLPTRASGLPRESKAQAEQVRAVAIERLQARLGRVPRRLMNDVDAALRLHLVL